MHSCWNCGTSFYWNQSMDTKILEKIIVELLPGGGDSKTYQAISWVHYWMDTRIGYPNEHLAGDSDEEFSSPYMLQ
jgi:hypothetical protein